VRVNADVSWPGHGSHTLDQCAARVVLYGEVIAFAHELLAQVGDEDFYRLYRTVEEVAKDKAEADARATKKSLDDMVPEWGQRLRVGMFSECIPTGVPCGTYEVVTNAGRKTERRYSVLVQDVEQDAGTPQAATKRFACITRMA
jgi:hypothetical protein